MMFSATMPPTIENLARRFMRSPMIVDVRPEYRTATGIDHRLYLVDPRYPCCLVALAAEEKGSMLIFLRRKIDVDWAADSSRSRATGREDPLQSHPEAAGGSTPGFP